MVVASHHHHHHHHPQKFPTVSTSTSIIHVAPSVSPVLSISPPPAHPGRWAATHSRSHSHSHPRHRTSSWFHAVFHLYRGIPPVTRAVLLLNVVWIVARLVLMVAVGAVVPSVVPDHHHHHLSHYYHYYDLTANTCTAPLPVNALAPVQLDPLRRLPEAHSSLSASASTSAYSTSTSYSSSSTTSLYSALTYHYRTTVAPVLSTFLVPPPRLLPAIHACPGDVSDSTPFANTNNILTALLPLLLFGSNLYLLASVERALGGSCSATSSTTTPCHGMTPCKEGACSHSASDSDYSVADPHRHAAHAAAPPASPATTTTRIPATVGFAVSVAGVVCARQLLAVTFTRGTGWAVPALFFHDAMYQSATGEFTWSTWSCAWSCAWSCSAWSCTWSAVCGAV